MLHQHGFSLDRELTPKRVLTVHACHAGGVRLQHGSTTSAVGTGLVLGSIIEIRGFECMILPVQLATQDVLTSSFDFVSK